MYILSYIAGHQFLKYGAVRLLLYAHTFTFNRIPVPVKQRESSEAALCTFFIYKKHPVEVMKTYLQ
jgi:hypothetical protein